MKYEQRGHGTLPVEVTNVSKHGFWIIVDETEMFLPFEHFPWFRHAPIDKILNVEQPSGQHLYWPELDIDLEIESILNPERYPLVSKVRETAEAYAAENSHDEWDWEKIDDTVLALLQLTLHDERCAWKGLDFNVLDRLFEKGFILDPKNKNKSIALTEKGLARSKAAFDQLFRKKL